MTELLHYPFSMVRYFVPEFIHRMRRSREVVEKPSPRQGIAMCDLLMPRYMRKGDLSIQDFVDVAVHTSKVDNQDVAHRVAIEILMDVEESDAEQPEMDTDALLGLMAPRNEEKLRFEFGEENDADSHAHHAERQLENTVGVVEPRHDAILQAGDDG